MGRKENNGAGAGEVLLGRVEARWLAGREVRQM